jgi:hypothetical protein
MLSLLKNGMMSNKVLFVVALLLTVTSIHAQNITDLYYFSNTNVQGTARSQGFGSALGSIGGDFSSLSVNPAGIGIYRTSEVSFSPSLKVGSSTSQYLGVATDDNNARFNVNNFGVVFTNAPKGKRYDHREWKAVSFGFGLNRLADFSRDYTYRGINYNSSGSQAFAADANIDTIIPVNSLGDLGLISNLIVQQASGLYTTKVPYGGGIEQVNRVRERGGINEMAISFGGNYKERLFLGATVGVPVLRYTRRTDYTENIIAANNVNNYSFETFTYNTKVETRGEGINLKLGAIMKVTNFFRLGAALHTPTAMWLRDQEDFGISSVLGGRSYFASTNGYLAPRVFDYRVITPMKSVLSAAIVIKKVGFVTADYEYVNYQTMKFRFPTGFDQVGQTSFAFAENNLNDEIRRSFQGASNLRLGAEIKLTQQFMIRGGFGYYGSPYINSTVDDARIDVGGGFGFRTRHFFADMAIVNRSFRSAENAYSFDYGLLNATPQPFPVATTDQSITNITFTVGSKF